MTGQMRLDENISRWALMCPEGAKCVREIDHKGIKADENLESQLDLGEWFSSLALSGVSVLYVYGVGDGKAYKAVRQWLSEDRSRFLVFLEDDPRVIYKLMETETGSQILGDGRVFLYLIGNGKNDHLAGLDILVMPFCYYSFAVAALPKYFREKPQHFVEIRSLIAFFSNIQKLKTMEYANSGMAFFKNFYRNLLMLPGAYRAEGLFGKFQGVPAIICGAGPSLDKNIDMLSSLKSRALIFAGGTALNAINAKDILPHFGVGIDPNPDQFSRIIMNQAYETPFFYRNRMLNEALKMVHGDKLFVTGSSGYEVGKWFEEKLGIEGRPIDEGYNVLNFTLSLAEAMGCNPIILVGVDLAYSQEKGYASGIVSHPIHDRKRNFSTKAANEELLLRKDINGNPVHTLWKWVMESLWYSKFARSHPDALIINATEGGIGFPGIENKTLLEVSEKYLKRSFDLDFRVHGEIQNSAMPAGVGIAGIKELMRELSRGLERLISKYQEMVDQLSKLHIQSLPQDIEAIYDGVVEKANEIINDEIYRVIIKPFDEAVIRFFALELERLKIDEGRVPHHETIFKRAAIDLERYQGFKNIALSQVSLIQAILQEYDADQEKEKIAHSHAKTDLQNLSERLHSSHSNRRIDGGHSKFFSEDGRLLASAMYVDGKPEGEILTFYRTGELHSLQHYHDGHMEGKQEFFYSNGLSKTIMTYANGRLNGRVQLYHGNGQLFRELNYLNGKRYGFDRIWDESGCLLIEAQFHCDNPVGIARKWHKNGVLASEITYDDTSNRLDMRHWTNEGQPLTQVADDYCQSMARQTENLTDSLSEVFLQVSKVASLFTDDAITDQLSDSKLTKQVSQDLSGDLKELRQEMSKLETLSNELKKHSEQDYASRTEDIIQDPAKKLLEQQLGNQNKQAIENIMDLEKGLKSAFDDLLKKIRNPPTTP